MHPAVKYLTISRESHALLRVIAAKRGRTMKQVLEGFIYDTAARELGDEVYEVLGYQEERGVKISGTKSNSDQGLGGSLGKAKKREDILGS